MDRIHPTETQTTTGTLKERLRETPDTPPTQDEAEVMSNLSRAGKRLIGFCRTNLFERLESSGHSFLLSVRRHILRNHVLSLHEEDRLCIPKDDVKAREPKIICSPGGVRAIQPNP